MSTAVATEPAQEFGTIFKENARLVYQTAYGVTGRHEDAEDVLQTVFLQLMRQEFPPDLRKNPQAYLYRAAINSSLNIVRRRRYEVLIDQDTHFEATSAMADNAEAEIRRLYEAIAKLKPDAAEIVILRYMHNKSDAEIAKILGRSRGAIALVLFRSRLRLKKLLTEQLGKMTP
jgi:RNA polymerase sigma-70 factor (ECF subfamily)